MGKETPSGETENPVLVEMLWEASTPSEACPGAPNPKSQERMPGTLTNTRATAHSQPALVGLPKIPPPIPSGNSVLPRTLGPER